MVEVLIHTICVPSRCRSSSNRRRRPPPPPRSLPPAIPTHLLLSHRLRRQRYLCRRLLSTRNRRYTDVDVSILPRSYHSLCAVDLHFIQFIEISTALVCRQSLIPHTASTAPPVVAASAAAATSALSALVDAETEMVDDAESDKARAGARGVGADATTASAIAAAADASAHSAEAAATLSGGSTVARGSSADAAAAPVTAPAPAVSAGDAAAAAKSSLPQPATEPPKQQTATTPPTVSPRASLIQSIDDLKAALLAKLKQFYARPDDSLMLESLADTLETCCLSNVRVRDRVRCLCASSISSILSVCLPYCQYSHHTVSIHSILKLSCTPYCS